VKKYLLILLFLTVIPFAHAEDQLPLPIDTCLQQLKYGLPTEHGDIVKICRHAYISAYDKTAKIPQWVAYNVEPKNAIGCVPRESNFAVETTVPPDARARTSDYAGSGFDIGHMADAASMSWSAQTEDESFILSNASPQTPNLNRGIWKLLEIKIRVWAYAGRSMTVYTGGIYDEHSHKIGDGVVVPDKFYKIVVDNTTGESLAFLFDNEPIYHNDLNRHIVPVAVIEAVTGLTFPIPGDKHIEGTLWPADGRKLKHDKRRVCNTKTKPI
jgi:endonuclease G